LVETIKEAADRMASTRTYARHHKAHTLGGISR
jgi:hypothetical protein